MQYFSTFKINYVRVYLHTIQAIFNYVRLFSPTDRPTGTLSLPPCIQPYTDRTWRISSVWFELVANNGTYVLEHVVMSHKKRQGSRQCHVFCCK